MNNLQTTPLTEGAGKNLPNNRVLRLYSVVAADAVFAGLTVQSSCDAA
jgi:hypothetical protein